MLNKLLKKKENVKLFIKNSLNYDKVMAVEFKSQFRTDGHMVYDKYPGLSESTMGFVFGLLMYQYGGLYNMIDLF